MRRKRPPSPNASDHFPRRPKGSRTPTVVPEEVITRRAYNRYEAHYIPLRNPRHPFIAAGISDLLNRASQFVAGRSNDARQVLSACQLILSRCNMSALREALEEYAENDDIHCVRDVLASMTDVCCGDCSAVIESVPDHVCDPVARREQARRAAEQTAKLSEMLNPRRGRRKS